MKFSHFLKAIFSIFMLSKVSAASGGKIAKEISFPFFENEFLLPENSFDLDFKGFKGQLKIAKTKVKGLDTLQLQAELDPKTGQTSSLIASQSEFGVSGNYEFLLEGTTPGGFHLEIIGNGSQENWIRNVSIFHEALLSDGASGYLEISALRIGIDFRAIQLGFYGISVNDFSLDWVWKPINRFLNNGFTEIFSEIEAPLIQLITRRLNALFLEKKLTLKDLVTILENADN